jgi:hypothetical protein
MELNCSILNEQLRHITPYIELERIHISKVSFHVSSWTNLRHSPITIDIDHVHVTMIEPFYYETDQRKRKKIRQVTIEELTQLMKDGIIPKPRQSSYNLLDRILDNLIMEIQSVSITYQPYGVFKTRRRGPWSPPTLLLQLFGIRWFTLDEDGNEISSNHHTSDRNKQNAAKTAAATTTNSQHDRPKKEGSFYIYKMLQADYQLSFIVTSPSQAQNTTATQPLELEEDTTVIPIVSSSTFRSNHKNHTIFDPRKKMNVQLSIQRRIRDGEYLAVQVDIIIPLIEVLLFTSNHSTNTATTTTTSTAAATVTVAKKLCALVHFVTAMQFCLQKDRAFSDPLRPMGSATMISNPQQQKQQQQHESKLLTSNNDSIIPVGVEGAATDASTLDESVSQPLTATMDEVSSTILNLTLTDGLSDSFSDDDGDDGNDGENDDENDTVDKLLLIQQQDVPATAGIAATNTVPIKSADSATADRINTKASTPITNPKSYIPLQANSASPGRHLLVFANGMMIHDKFSLSMNVNEIQMCGHYESTGTAATGTDINGDARLTAKGIVVEAIWPIVTGVCCLQLLRSLP